MKLQSFNEPLTLRIYNNNNEVVLFFDFRSGKITEFKPEGIYFFWRNLDALYTANKERLKKDSITFRGEKTNEICMEVDVVKRKIRHHLVDPDTVAIMDQLVSMAPPQQPCKHLTIREIE